MRSAIIICYNEDKFIEKQFKNIEGLVDEIIIVEGGDQHTTALYGSPRSTDKTLEIINDYKNKLPIKLFYNDGTLGKNQMVALANKNTHPNSTKIYHIDCDEFIYRKTIESSFDMLDKFDNVSFGQWWYYKWDDQLLTTNNENNNNLRHFPTRFYKNVFHKKGWVISHIPMNGYKYEGKHIPCKIIKHTDPMYHYLALYKEQLVRKFKYYAKRGDCTLACLHKKVKEFDSVQRNGIVKSYKNSRLKTQKSFLSPH